MRCLTIILGVSVCCILMPSKSLGCQSTTTSSYEKHVTSHGSAGTLGSARRQARRANRQGRRANRQAVRRTRWGSSYHKEVSITRGVEQAPALPTE